MIDKNTIKTIISLYNKVDQSLISEKYILTEIFENHLMPELGYKSELFRIMPLAINGEFYIQNIENPAQKIGLLICKDEISPKEETTLLHILEDNDLEWGYITNGISIVLVNRYIKTSKIESWKTSKKVLEVRIGKKVDMDYLQYFTREALFTDKNAMYFKDIAEYKNTQYRGSEGSWDAYNSSLRRFFRYYITKYGGRYDGYDKFNFADFEGFITEQNVKSPDTVVNMYAHISVYLRDKMGVRTNGFEMSRKDVLKVFTGVRREELGDILDKRRLQTINQFFARKQTHQLRNLAIFYLTICYGIERRQICQLKWSDIKWGEREIVLDKIAKPMPKQLVSLLRELEEKHKDKGYPNEYVFYVRRNGECYPITKDTINNLFSSLVEINPRDAVYTQYSPAKIRKTLAGILLKELSLQEVMRLLSIEAENLSRYLSTEEIFADGKMRLDGRKNRGNRWHPMEDVLDGVL